MKLSKPREIVKGGGEYLGLARAKLNQLRTWCAKMGLKTAQRAYSAGSATIIVRVAAAGTDTIMISGQPRRYAPYVVSLLAHIPLYNQTGYIAGKSATFGWSDNSVIVYSDETLDGYEHRLDGVAAMLAGEKLDMAEYLIRNIRFTSFLGIEFPATSDYALLCDEGLFVDPSEYEGQPFAERLNEIAEEYLGSFSHDALPGFASDFQEDEEYLRIYHGGGGREEQYKDAFFVFDPDRRLLPNTALVGAGGSLLSSEAWSIPNNPSISPEFPGFDFLPLGTQTMSEIQGRASFPIEVDVYGRRSTLERSIVRYQVMARNYRTVYVSTPGVVVRHRQITYSDGAGFYGPTSGEVSVFCERIVLRRSPSGWIEESRVEEPALSGLDCVLDGDLDEISPASGTLVAESTFDSLGATVSFATTAYTPSSVDYISGPTAFASFHPDSPTVTVTNPDSVDLARADVVFSRFSDAKHHFDRMGDGSIVVRSVEDDTTVMATPTTVSTPLPLGVRRYATHTWEAPFGSMTVEAGHAATVINGSLTYFKHCGSTARARLPPSAEGVGCVYFPASGKFMYAQLNDASLDGSIAFSNAKKAFLVGVAGNQSGVPELDEAGTMDERREALMSHVTVLASSPGLSHDLVALMSSSSTVLLI